MEDLQVTSEPIKENPMMQMSEADLVSQIQKLQSDITGQQTQPQLQTTGQVEVVQTPPQGQVTQPTEQPKPNTPTGESKVETPVEPKSQFDQLAQKQGFKSPDALAESYVNLRREFEKKSQELARMRDVPSQMPQPQMQPVQQPVQPVNPQIDEINRQFVQELTVNPVAAVAKLARAIAHMETQDIRMQSSEAQLRSEVSRLSNSPATAATFNSDKVQSEMKAIFQEDPAMLSPGRFTQAYERAVGRVAMQGLVSSPQQTVPAQAAFVEGKSRPITQQPVSPENMSMEQLRAAIEQIQSTLR